MCKRTDLSTVEHATREDAMTISDLQLRARLYFGIAALAGVDFIQLFAT